MNNARLASEIQRKSKTFSFDPFVILAAERLAGTTSHGLALIREDSDGDCHVRGLVADSHERFHKLLNSSSCLKSMSCDIAANIATALSNLASTSDSVVNLSQWMKRTISVASTNAVYGPLNPFAIDSRVNGAFWLVQSRLDTTCCFDSPLLTGTSKSNSPYSSSGFAQKSPLGVAIVAGNFWLKSLGDISPRVTGPKAPN